MLDIVKNKLQEIYDSLNKRHNTILELFIDQFGKSNVDSNIKTFDELVEFLNLLHLSNFINSIEAAYYNIDKQDYDTRGKNEPFLEYISDPNILDKAIPFIKNFLELNEDNSNTIIVHFPEVKITNEYDRFTYIQDLYAKIYITSEGTLNGCFELARTTYPYNQLKAGYAHSHIPKVCALDAGSWKRPCTGTGPINNTMETLKFTYDEQIWGLFTYELAKYVTIESVAGTPYIKLEDIGKDSVDESLSVLKSRDRSTIQSIAVINILKAFIYYYADNYKFRFKFVNGQYLIGENPISMIINLSNGFIEFLNSYKLRIADVPSLSQLEFLNILKKYIITNGKIYQLPREDRSVETAMNINGKDLFKFKGEMVKLKILFEPDTINNYSLLLTKNYCEIIITNVLTIINYQYGKTQNQGQSNQASRNQTTTSTSEKPLFI